MHGHIMYRSYDFAEVWEFECQMERFWSSFIIQILPTMPTDYYSILLETSFFQPQRMQPKDDLPSEARLSYTKRCNV
jgi:hypothetical protein